MMVDITDIKSKRVGENEKNIKEVFYTCRTAVENSEIATILFI
jgi:SpoVK/Ycf46/Vps4 family AAA+-type ATPase